MSADRPPAPRIHLKSVDSTNAEALRRAAGAGAPFWLIAGEQTSGRGRQARHWTSPRGNFYGTLLLHLDEPPARLALRSFVAALAVREALIAVTGAWDAFTLKWPNDVLWHARKISGILLEASGPALAIGIGVNLLSAPPRDALVEGEWLPVSLVAATGLRVTPDTFLDALAPAMSAWEERLLTRGFAAIRDEFLRHAAHLGQPIRARTARQVREGIFRHIDDAGNLVLGMAQGDVVLPAAEVFF